MPKSIVADSATTAGAPDPYSVVKESFTTGLGDNWQGGFANAA
jgi:hypothetical protein